MTNHAPQSAPHTYSVVIPTFRRPDMLGECLASLCALDYPKDRIEVLVVDNGGAENSRAAAEPFFNTLTIRYLVNRVNRGYGYSVNRGIVEATGDRIVLLNDDARPAPGLFAECERLLESDSRIGCVGCRAIETGYPIHGSDVGVIGPAGEIIGNFALDCGQPVDVDHVYGFCYIFTRQAVETAGVNDRTLLARPYSTGDRIETDHCLMLRRAGFRVVYHPGMTALHLAKPRPDINEASVAWSRNAIRNTLYLYLKHFGVFGRRAAALRLTFLRHVGVRSALLQPSAENLSYFVNGLRARASAYGHYVLYLLGTVSDRPEAVRALLQQTEGDHRMGAGR